MPFYGATECGGIAYDAGGTAAERGAVGEPIRGVEVSFEAVDGVDPQTGGRLIVRSPALATGYVPLRIPISGRQASGPRTSSPGRAASCGLPDVSTRSSISRDTKSTPPRSSR